MSEKIVENWYALAQYDVDSAEVMFKGGRYLYVAFMCQQAIEKTLKGYPSQGNKANASLHAQFTTTCGGAEFF